MWYIIGEFLFKLTHRADMRDAFINSPIYLGI